MSGFELTQYKNNYKTIYKQAATEARRRKRIWWETTTLHVNVYSGQHMTMVGDEKSIKFVKRKIVTFGRQNSRERNGRWLISSRKVVATRWKPFYAARSPKHDFFSFFSSAQRAKSFTRFSTTTSPHFEPPSPYRSIHKSYDPAKTIFVPFWEL